MTGDDPRISRCPPARTAPQSHSRNDDPADIPPQPTDPPAPEEPTPATPALSADEVSALLGDETPPELDPGMPDDEPEDAS